MAANIRNALTESKVGISIFQTRHIITQIASADINSFFSLSLLSFPELSKSFFFFPNLTLIFLDHCLCVVTTLSISYRALYTYTLRILKKKKDITNVEDSVFSVYVSWYFVLIYPCRCRWIRSFAVLFPLVLCGVFCFVLFFSEIYPLKKMLCILYLKISTESVGWAVLFMFFA